MPTDKVICVLSYCGPAACLPTHQRTVHDVLTALKTDPSVSTFDMDSKPWLRRCIKHLLESGCIREVDSQYPWHRYEIIESVVDAVTDELISQAPRRSGKRALHQKGKIDGSK